jgi:hypothetical protein
LPERNIGEVIDRIKAEVPDDLPALHAELADLRSSVTYTAPEMMRQCWLRLANILGENLPDPDMEGCAAWVKKVQRIVTAQE